jgi:two-component system chemotaxis sensor kinase CheA
VTLVGLVIFVGATLVLAGRLRVHFDATSWAALILASLGLAAAVVGWMQWAGGFELERDAPPSKVPEWDRDAMLDLLEASPLQMLLIDATYEIVGSYSRDLEALFHATELRDEDFLGVLRRVVSEPKVEATRDFLARLFDSEETDAAVESANPLKRVEAMLAGAAGASAPRVLSFGFKRIRREDAIERAVIWAEDLTDRLSDERRRHSADALKARRFGVLAELIHVPRKKLDALLADASQNLDAIDALLRVGERPSAVETGVFRQCIEDVLERVDAIESEADASGFGYMRRRAAAFREVVAALAARERFAGDDFLTLVMEQSAFRAEFDDLLVVRKLLDRPPDEDGIDSVAGADSSALATEAPSSDAVVGEIEALAQRLAAESEKEIVIDAEGFDTRTLGERRRQIIKDVLAELTRNALEHGIETPDVRQLVGKPRAGRIRIRQTNNGVADTFAFTFRDDGGGIDAPSLRERAVEHGLLEPDYAARIEDSQVAALIFAPELTAGMDSVKRKIVDECGGSISVDSEDGAFCEFTFVVPEAGK